MHEMSLSAFVELLNRENIQRFYLVWDEVSQSVKASHPVLQPLADFVAADSRDFDKHEGFFAQLAPETGVLQGASIHRTCRGQGAGGVRFWHYDTVEEYLRDGMRLAKGMTHKNALAGLWWGGGKGVMAKGSGQDDKDPSVRRRIYEEYGDFMTSLGGCYVTAEDVGTSVEDMAAIFSRTRFTTCIPPSLGGSGNPSVPTGAGVVRGMEAALQHLGMGDLEGKTVAIQGLGHVGEPMVGVLSDKGIARLLGTDIDQRCLARIKQKYPELPMELQVVQPEDNSILGAPCDIVSPCAVGAILNERTIPTIQARIVCGAANNQLEVPDKDDRRLLEAGVLYMPDFLVNRMGIVNCADEQFGYVDNDPIFQDHLGSSWDNSILNLSLQVLDQAKQSGRTPAEIALEIAEKRSFEPHPIWGHRPVKIIRSLIEAGWQS